MIFRRALVWFTNTKIYATIVLKIIPFIRFSVYYTPFRGNQYNAAKKVIKKGDYIVCKDSKKATAILIGGEWTHAVQFLGHKEDGAEYECAEMTHHNYTKSDLFDVCKESSEIAIYRCDDYDEPYVDKVVEKCTTFETALYDTAFTFGIRALYCSELIWQSDFEHRLQVNLEDLRSLGHQYISPSGLAKAKNVTCVFRSSNLEPRY